MRSEVKLDIQAQPDDESCGATCLHSLYAYYGHDRLTLRQTIEQIERVDSGGTIVEVLACHALRQGFDATIYTYHIDMFDPSWFAGDGAVHDASMVAERLAAQLKHRTDPRLKLATRACREFLDLGGRLKMEDLTPGLLVRYLSKSFPIMAGLSSTYLYRESRSGPNGTPDDISGLPQGHFVMLVGYDVQKAEVLIADPLDTNPPFHTSRYRLSIDRFINAVMLGILTHDAHLLVVQPRQPHEPVLHGPSARKKLPATRRKPRLPPPQNDRGSSR